MAQASRDNNSIPVALAYNGTTTQPLKVDSVTGRLLVAITSSASASGTRRRRARDDNSVPVSLAWNDNTSEVYPLITDTNGVLLIDDN